MAHPHGRNLLSITRMSGGQAKIERTVRRPRRSSASRSASLPALPRDQGFDRGTGRGADGADGRDAHPSGHYESAGNAAIHGGNVTQIRVCLSREGTNACFSVSDNGVGIPKERLSTIFNGGLSGVSHNNFDMKKNMGIGLSVCYTIVKAHGGHDDRRKLRFGRSMLPLLSAAGGGHQQ